MREYNGQDAVANQEHSVEKIQFHSWAIALPSLSQQTQIAMQRNIVIIAIASSVSALFCASSSPVSEF